MPPSSRRGNSDPGITPLFATGNRAQPLIAAQPCYPHCLSPTPILPAQPLMPSATCPGHGTEGVQPLPYTHTPLKHPHTEPPANTRTPRIPDGAARHRALRRSRGPAARAPPASLAPPSSCGPVSATPSRGTLLRPFLRRRPWLRVSQIAAYLTVALLACPPRQRRRPRRPPLSVYCALHVRSLIALSRRVIRRLAGL